MKRRKWVFKRNSKRKFVWKRYAANGRLIESSTQGYRRKIDCRENAALAGWDATQDTRFQW